MEHNHDTTTSNPMIIRNTYNIVTYISNTVLLEMLRMIYSYRCLKAFCSIFINHESFLLCKCSL